MNKTDQQNIMVLPSEWHIRYEYAAGEVTSTFLRSLKNKKIILGTKCPKCSLVMLPPRGYCERCFVPAKEYVQVGTEGMIEAATIVTQKFENLPDPPYAIAYVRLDGASTAMINFVHGVDLTDVEKAPFQICRRMFSSVFQEQLTLTMSEVIGHLDLLEDQGKIYSVKKGKWYKVTAS